MEGVRDGFAGDSCFVCGLLWPEVRPCPRCFGRMSWIPAGISDEAIVMVKVARAYDDWCALGDDLLEALLRAVHEGGDAGVAALEDLGGSVDELRRAWSRVAPDDVPY